jgi:hypothetical protein
MKITLSLLFITLFCSLQINGQTRQEIFSGIQELVNKASGENVQNNDVFSKKDDKLGKQVFTEKELTVNTISDKSKYEWISRATDISWNDFFDYEIYTEFKNGKLQIVELNFNKNFKSEYFKSEKTADEYPSSSTKFKFYVLTIDKQEITQLLTRLYDLKEKKPESQFNNEIRKFSKAQTISWLTEKLQKHLVGDDYTNSLNITSIDECNLEFDYSNFVGRKYRETIPTSIESINKYNLFTYDKKICVSKSFAFGMIQEQDETTYKDYSFLNINTTDEDLVSNIEAAMKHLANYCNGTNLDTGTKSTTDNSSNKAVSDKTHMLDLFIPTKEFLLSYTTILNDKNYFILSAEDFAELLNENVYGALNWAGDESFQFEIVGKTDFSKKSLEFIIKDNELYAKLNIPLNGTCDYGLKEFKVNDSDISDTFESNESESKYYYLTFNFEYECEGKIYKYLSIYIEDKTLESFEKVKTYFAEYGK